MTIRWIPTSGFELGAGVRWGDAKHRSWIWAVHLGRRTLLGLVRWWL